MSRRLIAIIVVGVVIAVLGIGAVVLWPRGTSEVERDEALKDFRQRQSTTTERPGSVGSDVPAPGVYSYAATGSETVKLGPLPEENRPLPETVTAVVVESGDGCFEFTVNYFEEHTEDSRWCVSDGALRLEGHQKHQKIGALSPTANITCDPNIVRTPDAESHPLECTLELTGGPVSVSTNLEGRASTGERTTLEVGGVEVDAVPLTLDFDVIGSVSGKWIETIWLTADNLPVKMERSFDLSGRVRFKEETTLTLTSLKPAD